MFEVSLDSAIYGLVLVIGIIVLYSTYSYASHRYKLIHEGFKLRQKNQNKDGKEHLTELNPADINDDENLKKKKNKISKLLDEAYEELNKTKHKEDYRELIDELDELVNANILQHIMSNKDKLLDADLNDETSMNEIKRINDLDNFKEVLKNMSNMVDKS